MALCELHVALQVVSFCYNATNTTLSTRTLQEHYHYYRCYQHCTLVPAAQYLVSVSDGCFDQSSVPVMDRPTILIVPGGFTLPELYNEVISHVSSKGYPVHALHLPSVGYKTNHPGTMQDDAAFISAEVSKHANEGRDVVLVGHSYGGVPATESTRGLSKLERQQRGNPGGLMRIAYISCIILPVGESDASVIMPDNMLPRASPFEIRFDVSLPPSNGISRAKFEYRMMVGCTRQMHHLLFPMYSMICQRKRAKSGPA
jgi:hypothetical protein